MLEEGFVAVFSLSKKEAAGTALWQTGIVANRALVSDVHPLDPRTFCFRQTAPGGSSYLTVSFQWRKDDRTRPDRGQVAYCV